MVDAGTKMQRKNCRFDEQYIEFFRHNNQENIQELWITK